MVQNSFFFFSESLIPLLLKCCGWKKASPPQTSHLSDYSDFSFYCLTIAISLIANEKECLTEMTWGINNFLWVVFTVASAMVDNYVGHCYQGCGNIWRAIFTPRWSRDPSRHSSGSDYLPWEPSVCSLPPSNIFTSWIYLISLCSWPQTCDLIIFPNSVIYLPQIQLTRLHRISSHLHSLALNPLSLLPFLSSIPLL